MWHHVLLYQHLRRRHFPPPPLALEFTAAAMSSSVRDSAVSPSSSIHSLMSQLIAANVKLCMFPVHHLSKRFRNL
ncbi:hypothetical protein TNCV_484671 [Trichonephila clavipes]|nr:hypothetical protein TNCV_484671 [Trichonephila clavipes]